jgi:hypothetical protein
VFFKDFRVIRLYVTMFSIKKIYGLFSLLAASTISACMASEPEKPGNLSNPKLASMLQKAFESEIAGMNPVWKPGLKPGSNILAQSWLSKINEISSRCKYGPENRSKFNTLEYTIRLNSGESITGVYSGLLCQYQPRFGKPLIVLVSMVSGKVTDVKTDGRERDFPVSYANEWVNNLAEKVLGVDQTNRSNLYYGVENSKQDNRKEWTK